MKRFTFLTVLLLSVTFLSAQTSKRVSAYNYLKDGELDLAKENIDKCVLHAKTAKDARAWLYYGQIYHSIAISKDKLFSKLDADAEIKAYEGYKKAILYNFKDESLHSLDIDNNQMDMIKFAKALYNQDTKYVDQKIVMDVLRNRYPALSNALVNKGLKEYQETHNYKKALDLFERSLFTSQMVSKSDTQAVYFCALAAVKAKETDKAINYYKALTEVAYGKTNVDKANNYYFLAQQYLEKKDTAKYVSTLEEGIQKYPKSSSSLLVQMINYYNIIKKDSKAALAYLDKAIESSPNDENLYFNKGLIYDTDSTVRNVDEAVKAYNKALEINPKHFDSYYGLGAVYYNLAAEKIEEANQVDPDDFKKYKAVKSEADKLFKQSLPYLEKAHELNDKDLPTIQSLKLIYYRLGMLEKSDEMKAKLQQ